jgi:hypothetical protein
VFILAVAALEIHEDPAVPLHQSYCIADLHI